MTSRLPRKDTICEEEDGKKSRDSRLRRNTSQQAGDTVEGEGSISLVVGTMSERADNGCGAPCAKMEVEAVSGGSGPDAESRAVHTTPLHNKKQNRRTTSPESSWL